LNGALVRIDLGVVITANLMNLLLAGMFYFRARRKPQIGEVLGWIAVALAVPLAAAAVLNRVEGRAWPFWGLPLAPVAYCLVELLLDGVLKFDFRHRRWLGPYLGLYYLGLFALIGYAFLVGRPQGFVTLVTYFINLAVTFYAYARVGHS
jgi:hypothetical protein